MKHTNLDTRNEKTFRRELSNIQKINEHGNYKGFDSLSNLIQVIFLQAG